jgi:hypothetical protein
MSVKGGHFWGCKSQWDLCQGISGVVRVSRINVKVAISGVVRASGINVKVAISEVVRASGMRIELFSLYLLRGWVYGCDLNGALLQVVLCAACSDPQGINGLTLNKIKFIKSFARCAGGEEATERPTEEVPCVSEKELLHKCLPNSQSCSPYRPSGSDAATDQQSGEGRRQSAVLVAIITIHRRTSVCWGIG